MLEVSWKKLGENIRRERLTRGWTIGETALRMEKSRRKIRTAEHGERCITVHELMEFCMAFGIEPDILTENIRK